MEAIQSYITCFCVHLIVSRLLSCPKSDQVFNIWLLMQLILDSQIHPKHTETRPPRARPCWQLVHQHQAQDPTATCTCCVCTMHKVHCLWMPMEATQGHHVAPIGELKPDPGNTYAHEGLHFSLCVYIYIYGRKPISDPVRNSFSSNT
jgi:hypothetical protein